MFFDHYPYTNFHNVNLDWVLQAVKAWGATVEANDQAFQDLEEANESFKSYVTNYLQNLDVQDEINTKLDQLLADGILTPYFAPYVKGYVESWLAANVTPTSPALDETLTLDNAAALSSATGERIARAAFLRTLDAPDLYKMLNKNLIIPGYRIQSACHAGGYFYVCGGSEAADGNGYIAKMRDLDFKDAEITYIEGLGHANDITYSYTDHYLYVTTVGEGTDWGILKINPEDYTDKTLITNCPTNTIGIQYVRGWVYILAPYHIYRTNDFQTYTLVIDNTNDILNKFGIQSTNRISQTLVRVPDSIFGWVGSFIKEPEHTWYGFIVYFGSHGAITFDLFPTYNAECQAGVWDGSNTIYFLNNGTTSPAYSVLKTDAGDLKYELLAAGNDLNDYTGEGVYYLLGSAAMDNCPVSNEGLTLRVGPQGLLNTRQDIYTNSGRHLYRIKLFNPGTWGAWTEPAAEVAQIKEDLSQGVALERYNKLSPSWTLGFIKSDGAFGNSTNSVLSSSNAYSGFIIAESDVMSVEIKSGYKALVAEYVIPARGAVNFISKTEYATGAVEFNVHAGSYCLFVLMLESEQRFAPSDVPDDAVVVTGWRKAINHYNFIKPLKITDGYFLSDRYINSKNAWQKTNTKKSAMLFKVSKGYYTIVANTVYDTIWALLAKDFSLDSVPERPPFVQYGGRNTITKGTTSTIYIAQDSVLYIYYSTQSDDMYYPTSVTCRVDVDNSLSVNGAPADAKMIGNKFDYALAPLERIYNLYNSDEVYNGFGLNQGVLTTDATAKTTDFIAIPKKYNKNLLYTHLLVNGEYGGSISFYDASKNYISTVQVTSYVQNVTDSEYIRCTVPIDTSVTITISNETIIPQVREQFTFNNGRRNWFGQRMVSDGCMTSMIKTALAYTGSDEYGYGTEHTAFGEECIKTTKDEHTTSSIYEGERYQIDCSTYVLLIIMGIKPQCSRYHYTKNIPAPYGYVFNTLANYEGWVYGVPQTMNTKRLYANSIADYANRNGYLYSVNDDFSNVQPGDIVFWSNQGVSFNFFENIGHCAFVYNVIDMENGAKAVETLEANGGTGNPCHRRTYLEKPAKMFYGAKLPYSYVSGNAKNIANFSNDVSIVGGGTADIQLGESIRKGNVYTVIAHASDIMSGYITLSVDGLSYTGYTSEDVIHRPDGIVVVRFTVPMSYDVDATKIVLTYVGDDSITLNNVSVYDGYVTESVI